MKSVIDCSRVFESNIRILMVSSLTKGPLTYRQLKDICICTDGNMATHIKKLLAEEFITEKKEFVNRKPQTTYTLTEKARVEFKEYVEVLNELVKHA